MYDKRINESWQWSFGRLAPYWEGMVKLALVAVSVILNMLVFVV